MPLDAARAKSLFLAASDLADAAERAAYLERECGGDAELRGRVEALLRANDAAPSLPSPDAGGGLGGGAGDGTGAYVPDRPRATEDYGDPTARVGAILAGKYKLIEEIGEGGMGSVYLAQQTEPVKRAVAIKVIKAGMDSKAVLTRFEAERQALAMMDHPNIAKVLDAGTTDGGRPFFVMELVKGLPITKFCDERKLTPRQRLELFVPVCQAIQHAHQKGIIHRDIKPSNVLVAMYDDRPVPKVIDFGVAKATGGALTEQTLETAFGGVVGTPQYMSPEQANLNNLDIDTRSDVYALGVLLYELLTGSTPFSGEELKKKGLLEILRVVREEEPPRPSTKLSTADALPSLSANRGTEPKKLTGLLRMELDWVVMKALEKDRTRRYETANGFAADVLRYLAGEAVQAHPPSTVYRLKKFVRRNRPQVIAASLVLVALLAGIAGTSWQAIRAKRQEGIARKEAQAKELARAAEAEQRQAAERAAGAEKSANEQAQKRLAQIEKGNEIITSIFTDLDIVQVKQGREPLEAVLAKRLVKAGEQLEGESVGDPLAVAHLQERLGMSLRSLGYPNEAIGLLVKARATFTAKLGGEARDTLHCMNDLAGAYRENGKLELAQSLFEETLRIRQSKFGVDDASTITSMGNLAGAYLSAGKLDLALPLLEESLKLHKEKFGLEDRNTLTCMNNLALAFMHTGKPSRAQPLLEEVFRLQKTISGADHHQTLTTMNNLAVTYMDTGKLDKALPIMEEALKLKKASLGADHPHTLVSMNNLAKAYADAGKWIEAVPLMEETLKLQKAKLGPDHPQTLNVMGNLAAAYQVMGKRDLALPLLEETVKLTAAKLGADHYDTLFSKVNLARIYRDANQLDKALPLLEETLKAQTAKLGAEHPLTIKTMGSLAVTYLAAGKIDLALPLLEEALKLAKAKQGTDHPDTLSAMADLARGYHSAKKLDLALPLYEEALKLRKAKLGTDHPLTLLSMNNLAGAYQDAGKPDLALPLYEETLKLQKAKLGADHPYTLTSLNNLAAYYRDAGKLDLALPLFQEAALSIEKRRFQHHHAGRIIPNLIDCHERLKQFDQAETWRRKWLAVVKLQSGADSVPYAGELVGLGQNLMMQQKWADAESVLRECLAIREKTQPDVWSTFNTKSSLGGALLSQKKYADAEPLLLAGYEGLKQREKTIPPQGSTRIPEAIDRLIELCMATNKPDEVRKWQEERAKYPQAKTPEEKK